MAIYPDRKPVSKPLNPSDNIGGLSLPETHAAVRDKAHDLQPEQVHLTYWGTPSKMLVSFASGDGRVVKGRPPSPPKASSGAVAQFGANPGGLVSNVPCTTVSYVQDQFEWLGSEGYVSPFISHCLMTGLPAGSTVFYRVGWPSKNQWSRVFNFTTYSDTGNFPFVIGVVADLGTSYNASLTVDQTIQSKPQLVLNVGDISYADVYFPNGTQGFIKKYYCHLNYQPRWDMYGRMMQKLAAYVPVMTSAGNHDMEFQPDGTVFAALTHRYPVPPLSQGADKKGNVSKSSRAPPVSIPLNKFSDSNPSPHEGLFYSFDVPGTAHIIAMSSYIPNDTFTEDTAQYKWFAADLAKVDREKTPWLIVMFHAPLVSSYEDAFKQAECMRFTYEPLIYKYEVDVVLNGHVHAYERTEPVYNYTLNPCGAVHITIGTGGKPGIADTGEYALDLVYIETQPQPKYCADPSLLETKFNPTQPRRCYTSQPHLGGFCWNKQPDFSAYRESAYGHGALHLINATHAEWKWNRNVDGMNQTRDYVMLNRVEPASCLRRNG